jgi:hypothetical protein
VTKRGTPADRGAGGGAEQEGLDALLVPPAEHRYLTGFSGSAGLFAVRRATAVLITDFRYAVQAPLEAPRGVQIDPVSIWDRLGRVLGNARWTGSAWSRMC